MRTSANQTKNYVYYFTSKHSWYKHLSWDVPTDFIFYLDKNAWTEKVSSKNILEGKTIKINTTPETEFLREKYGFWCFNGGLIRGIKSDVNKTYRLNENREVEELTTAEINNATIGLTAFIHSSFSSTENEEHRNKHISEVNKLQKHLLKLLTEGS